MSPTRQTLHNLIDIVDNTEYELLYHLLLKFVPEDEATPDEEEAMRIGKEQFARGEVVRHEDMDWD